MRFLLSFLLPFAASNDVVLESFVDPVHTWVQQNDPVMGGESSGTFSLENGVGVFQGSVVDVPSLSAPGFIKVQSTDRVAYPNISSCDTLYIEAQADNDYTGYRVGLGRENAPNEFFFARGHKAPFLPSVGSLGRVEIPLSEFSSYWNDATGDIVKSCSDFPEYCLTPQVLSNIQTASFWAEGVSGEVRLEISSFGATGCGTVTDLAIVTGEDYCGGASAQANMRYNISAVAKETEYFAYGDLLAPGQDLVDAVCCDSNFVSLAEPPNLFSFDNVQLFAEMEKYMDENGEVVFYDSVCGIPLYVAPRGRTFREFKEDTIAHNYPSFREAERIEGATYRLEGTEYVFSSCGTHIGSYLPEDSPWGSERDCIDTLCVAGNTWV